jgi:PEP-CTERM motif
MSVGYDLSRQVVVPEPSTMLVAALGLSAYGWRRRKQRAEETVA